MLVPVGDVEVPCEVKHYADRGRIRWRGIGTAVTQVVAGMIAVQADEGLIVSAIGNPQNPTYRYEIEVTRLVRV